MAFQQPILFLLYAYNRFKIPYCFEFTSIREIIHGKTILEDVKSFFPYYEQRDVFCGNYPIRFVCEAHCSCRDGHFCHRVKGRKRGLECLALAKATDWWEWLMPWRVFVLFCFVNCLVYGYHGAYGPGRHLTPRGYVWYVELWGRSTPEIMTFSV